MITALIYLGVSLFISVALFILFRVEDKRGRLVLLSGLRSSLDKSLANLTTRLEQRLSSGWGGSARLAWYYIIHSSLERLISWLAMFRRNLEGRLKRNRQAAKRLRLASRPLANLKSLKKKTKGSEEGDEERG